MQRTAPVLGHLTSFTLESLLNTFSNLLMESRCILRILPWIWQLTESSNQVRTRSLSSELQEKILTALKILLEEEVEEQEQINALVESLQKQWSSSYGVEESGRSMNGSPEYEPDDTFLPFGTIFLSFA